MAPSDAKNGQNTTVRKRKLSTLSSTQRFLAIAAQSHGQVIEFANISPAVITPPGPLLRILISPFGKVFKICSIVSLANALSE